MEFFLPITKQEELDFIRDDEDYAVNCHGYSAQVVPCTDGIMLFIPSATVEGYKMNSQ